LEVIGGGGVNFEYGIQYLLVTGLSQQLLLRRLFQGNDLGVEDANFKTLFHSFCHSSSENTRPYYEKYTDYNSLSWNVVKILVNFTD
jgi:hypothetical protein